MFYIFLFLMGLLAGALCIFLFMQQMRIKLRNQKIKQDEQERKNQAALTDLTDRQNKLDQQEASLKSKQREFDGAVIAYKHLQDENAILKNDLQNIDVNLRKLELDREIQNQRQDELDNKATELGSRYLKENIKWIGSSLTANNFAASKQRLLGVIERCRGIGFAVSEDEESNLINDLKAEFEKIVRAQLEREEQSRIKEQIREEQKLEREIERELKQLDRERTAIQAALDKALAEAKDQHSAEVERLRARLAEAEEKSQRAKSRAEMTKSGHVYVVSNIGSFGEGVFKIGMTRRLEPEVRVRELGNASVPFPFDIHMMIACDDAPSLENALHRALHKARVNKANPRKEYFRSEIDTLRRLVQENHGEVQYIADPEALEYRQSLAMTDDDAEYIDGVYSTLNDEDDE